MTAYAKDFIQEECQLSYIKSSPIVTSMNLYKKYFSILQSILPKFSSPVFT